VIVLDPEISVMLDALRAGGVFTGAFDPIAFRAQFEAMSPAMWNPDGLTVAAVERITIAGAAGDPLEAIVYRPPEPPGAPPPVLLFFHGGGFTSGSVNTSDAHCRYLAREAGCIVVNCDYRLAPEHPFPAGVEDACAALHWLFENVDALGGDRARIAVGGDAPGGNMAAVAAIVARNEGLPLKFQFLLAPATDFQGDYPGKRDNLAIGPVVAEALAVIEACYLPDDAARADWRCSPLRAPVLRGLAPAFILVGEYDFLTPEIDAYVARLRDEGVAVTYHRWPAATHNFFSMYDQLAIARVAMAAAAVALRQGLE
jgi:acetyl esterase